MLINLVVGNTWRLKVLGYENCGRKPLGWYRDLNDLLDRSLKEVMAAFDNPDIPQLEKAKIGQAFLSKRIGEKIDLTIEHVLQPEQLELLKGRIIELKSGKVKAIESTND